MRHCHLILCHSVRLHEASRYIRLFAVGDISIDHAFNHSLYTISHSFKTFPSFLKTNYLTTNHTTDKMQLTPHLASLVLLFSALVAAAPAAMPEPALDIRAESIAAVPTAGSIFESREATCNAPRPKDAAKLREYNAKMSEMAAATVKAHQGEQKCKSGEFISSKNKQVKERVKNNCVAGYTQ